MRILVLGGTQFLGRHVVDAALARGHEVTLFNRGQTRPELFPDAERLRGDRDGDLSALGGRVFDAVVDTSGYVPRIVGRTLDALRRRGSLHVRVLDLRLRRSLDAADGVVAGARARGADRGVARGLRRAQGATARDVVLRALPGRVHPAARADRRPVGSDRTVHVLAARIADGGQVLAPAPPDAAAQVIDARDLAAWIVRAAETRARRHLQRGRPADDAGGAVRDVRRRRRRRRRSSCGSTATSSPRTRSVSGWSCRSGCTRPSTAGCSRSTRRRPSRPGSRRARSPRRSRDTLAWVQAGDAPADTPGRARTREGTPGA